MNIKITNKDGVTLKTKGKYCKEDISVAVDESILGITPTGTYQVTDNGEYDVTEYAKVNVNVPTGGGGGIEVPQVSNIMLNSSGILSWTPPTITDEEIQSISYLLNVNGIEMETAQTAINIISYINEGDNSISIITKVIRQVVSTHNSNSLTQIVEYSFPKEIYTTLSAISFEKCNVITIAMEDKIYIFGGSSDIGGGTVYNTIQYYDPTTDTLTNVNATLTKGVYNAGGTIINGKVYIFGGETSSTLGYHSKDVQCYDPITQKTTKMNAIFSENIDYARAATFDNKAYIFHQSPTTIYCYDPTTDTLTTMSATFSKKGIKHSAKEIKGLIYVVHQYGHIYCYDPTTDTLASKFNAQYQECSVVAVGDRLYMFGGHKSGQNDSSNLIQCYDTVSNTVTTLTSTLNKGKRNAEAEFLNGKAYIFGGNINYSTKITEIEIVHNLI